MKNSFASRGSGQTFMPDYMGSILVFGILATIFLHSWNSVLQDQTRFSQEEEMRFRGFHTTVFLVSTPGYPEDWNSSNVEIPGFADPSHVIQSSKLEEFRDLSYSEQTRLLEAEEFYMEVSRHNRSLESESLGSLPVAYMPREGRQMSEVEVLDVLNGSGLTWDLYWPSNKDEDKLDSLDARRVYNYTDQGDAMFDDLLVNASSGSYETVISENTNLDTGDIQNETELEQFVRDGGSFIHMEEKPELIRDTFDFEEASVGSDNGSVENSSVLLNDSYEVGDFVQFQDEPMAFENVSLVIVRDTESPKGCLACRWDVGSGKVYYLQDELSESGELTSFETTDGVFETLYVFGKDYEGADTIVPFTRTVDVNLSGKTVNAELRYIPWR